jgi:hypothetical protein
MGTSLARRYLGTIWTLIALGTLGTYIDVIRNDGSVEGKDWGFAAAGLAIGLGLIFYDRIRPPSDGSGATPAEKADEPDEPDDEDEKN